MKSLFHLLPSLLILILASCGTGRTDFAPGGPTTVGMPQKLSERERTFIPEIDAALRREGLVPVKYDKGDLQLDFTMSSGPIHIETSIALLEDKAVLLSATGKSGGLPMVGRDNVARKSFDEAFADFQSAISRVSKNRGWSGSASLRSPATGSVDESLPVD
ncbi:MAG: hypothetical protein RL346_113 [Verrucomicrobiota bacterium]